MVQTNNIIKALEERNPDITFEVGKTTTILRTVIQKVISKIIEFMWQP